MDLNSTAKISFHDHTINWSQVKAHVNREHSHYSNKHINLLKSVQNYAGQIHDIHSENVSRFALYILLHNIWERSHGHKNRVYKNVHEYFKKSGINPERNTVFQLGNKKVRKEYYSILNGCGLDNDQIRGIENQSLVNTVHEYEHRTNQHVGYYSTNLDETSAHVHIQNGSCPTIEQAKKAVSNNPHLSNKQKKNFINYFKQPVNFTPRGKKWKRKLKKLLIRDFNIDPKTANEFAHHTVIQRPSTSFNSALYIMHPGAINSKGQPDSRKAMRLANLNISKMIIKNFNKELSNHNIALHLNFVRTGKTTNLDNSAYEKSMENQKLLRNRNRIINSLANNAVNEATPEISHQKHSVESEASSNASSISIANSSISNATDSLAIAQSSFTSEMISSSLATSKSISASASASIKARDNSLAYKSISLSNKSAIFDSSAYGRYARQLSNTITPIIKSSEPSNYWLQFAKGKRYFKNGSNDLINPLGFVATSKANKINSANTSYNHIQKANKRLETQNQSLSGQNSDLSNQNSNLNNQINHKENILNELNNKIKSGYNHFVAKLLDDVTPSDKTFSYLNNQPTQQEHNKEMYNIARGKEEIPFKKNNGNLHYGLSAVFHMIGHDIKHVINKSGIEKAKQDTKNKELNDFDSNHGEFNANDDIVPSDRTPPQP